MSHATELRRRLETREGKIAVVGLGYVGLPLVRAMHDAGFGVIGYDCDEEKIRMLSEGQAYLQHLGEDLTRDLAASDRFRATAVAEDLKDADVILLCVPSPLGRHNEPDMSYIVESTRMVADVLQPGQLVCLESTTYPGTTRGDCQPILEEAGLECGKDFFLAFSPEREDPGRADYGTSTIPKLVGGVDEISTDLAMQLYAAAITKVVAVSTAEVAELPSMRFEICETLQRFFIFSFFLSFFLKKHLKKDENKK